MTVVDQLHPKFKISVVHHFLEIINIFIKFHVDSLKITTDNNTKEDKNTFFCRDLYENENVIIAIHREAQLNDLIS